MYFIVVLSFYPKGIFLSYDINYTLSFIKKIINNLGQLSTKKMKRVY
jgi:hypothetical protein